MIAIIGEGGDQEGAADEANHMLTMRTNIFSGVLFQLDLPQLL